VLPASFDPRVEQSYDRASIKLNGLGMLGPKSARLPQADTRPPARDRPPGVVLDHGKRQGAAPRAAAGQHRAWHPQGAADRHAPVRARPQRRQCSQHPSGRRPGDAGRRLFQPLRRRPRRQRRGQRCPRSRRCPTRCPIRDRGGSAPNLACLRDLLLESQAPGRAGRWWQIARRWPELLGCSHAQRSPAGASAHSARSLRSVINSPHLERFATT
jgi:hypothetical protein